MPLQIIRNDITKIPCDAIVNAANPTLLGGGGVDGAIHRAAGKELFDECLKLNGCKTGEAKITKGYRLPCKYVIHTVGPVWQGGRHQEKELLASCYRSSLALAKEYGCRSVAFPLISSGAYGYPKSEAMQIAINEISSFLMTDEMLVYIVVFDSDGYLISKKLFTDIKEYIDQNYVDAMPDLRSRLMQSFPYTVGEEPSMDIDVKAIEDCKPCECGTFLPDSYMDRELEQELEHIDESFSQMLLRIIDQRGITDAECYKKANIDRKLFSKIRNNIHYRPKKQTVVAFAVALELSLEETKEMLSKAGYSLTKSSRFDIIIEFFIKREIYDIFKINEALFAFDQVILG